MFLAFFINSEEVGVMVLCIQSVKVVVEFLVELGMAVRTQQAGSVNSGGESMSYHKNMMKLDNVHGQFATTNITCGVLLIENAFSFFAARSQVFLLALSAFQHPFLFLLHLDAPRIYWSWCEQIKYS